MGHIKYLIINHIYLDFHFQDAKISSSQKLPSSSQKLPFILNTFVYVIFLVLPAYKRNEFICTPFCNLYFVFYRTSSKKNTEDRTKKTYSYIDKKIED